MADRRVRVLHAGGGGGRGFTVLSVRMVELLGAAVVWFEVSVTDRPGRGDAADMAHFAKILLAQSQQRSAVELGVAADPIVDIGVEWRAVGHVPGLFGLVASLARHHLGIPGVLGAWQEIAAL